MSATMLRSIPRAGQSSFYLRPSSLRTNLRPSSASIPTCSVVTQQQQSRQASAQHAISNPTLAGIEKRWEQMNPQEQADLWMALRDRMKIDWHELTLQEKKAGQYKPTSRSQINKLPNKQLPLYSASLNGLRQSIALIYSCMIKSRM